MTATTREPTAAAGRAAAQWELWTTTVRVVVTEATALGDAMALLTHFLAEVEAAASRFRPDSEVSRIAASPATEHEVSPLLAEMVRVALRAAAVTDGSVDPTIGTVLARLETTAPAPRASTVRRAGWRDVALDGRVLRLPAGTLLDLGATGKAFAADRAAVRLADALGCGVLVSLGGDLRAAGPDPDEPWTVLVRDRAGEPASLVDLGAARALATSSSLHRTVGPELAHHVIDPVTVRSVQPVWRTVSVAAETCVQANTWSTAAMVRGAAAPDLLAATGLPARLVAAGGRVRRLGGWPEGAPR
ncbi:MAG TPA: FAD:protein FMN transferase [Motilibacteraceae bacterium]|nr:FAD:protein FMN transferase [Motilibacteraceae bacterium]